MGSEIPNLLDPPGTQPRQAAQNARHPAGAVVPEQEEMCKDPARDPSPQFSWIDISPSIALRSGGPQPLQSLPWPGPAWLQSQLKYT